MSPSVSIILVTYNSAAHLEACCASLRALRYEPAPQVVVVDNASQDDSVALVRRLLPEALLLPQAANLGFGGGVHIGAAASSGECLVLLNPDTAVDPGWLTALVAMLDNPRCGIAGSKILDVRGETILHAGGAVSRPDLLASHRGYGEPDRGQYDSPEAVPFVTGASLALRRELWDRLGGLDVGFFPGYFEDVDLCWRAQSLGLECWYAPRSLLSHSESASTGKDSGAFYYYHHLSRLRFACKHLPWAELWGDFAPAESLRLLRVSALDRAVSGLVYRQALPHGLAAPDAAAQATILRCGQTLGAIGAHLQDQPDAWPAPAQELLGVPAGELPALPALLAEAEAEAVLAEHQFRSAIPLVSALRRAWNSVATRWYVLPLLHQQTRFNLAAQRSIARVQRRVDLHTQSAILETQLRQALLCYRIASLP
ncbi:glycosyltransferase family 2 protein [Oscillochloris sp. ZM17-4]|uniref:glycosyltransferase family 2 protein n=1 Tax=Oscillochloris sp. ZM17-4 TaxID=2866714 RepID=UPI001C7337A3|nr:glycosyltransferase family 2 protein [Oscillochloris sp. ZM17-4]MBX0328977.1 glycosyltransferase family 2 protein [Oscillochloris sp. ZM17-4]